MRALATSMARPARSNSAHADELTGAPDDLAQDAPNFVGAGSGDQGDPCLPVR